MVMEKTMSLDTGMPTAPLTADVDGTRPPTPDLVATITALCDRAEDAGDGTTVVVRVGGAPGRSWTDDLTVAQVSRWEQALRRLERLPAVTVGVAAGDCGGTALDALMATDHRVAATSARLVVPVHAGATWPGMALYRMARHVSNAAALRRTLLFGAALDAQDALALHLLHEVTGDVPGALAALSARTAAVSGRELAVRRQLIFDAATTSFEDALGVHLAACDRALRRTRTETPS
jgi:isomerase DpgB